MDIATDAFKRIITDALLVHVLLLDGIEEELITEAADGSGYGFVIPTEIQLQSRRETEKKFLGLTRSCTPATVRPLWFEARLFLTLGLNGYFLGVAFMPRF